MTDATTSSSSEPPRSDPASDAQPFTLRFRVNGMHCASCSSAVESALARAEGVRDARVNLATETAVAEIHGRSDAETTRQLQRVVQDAGYDVETRTERFEVDGMHCASCSNRVEHALQEIPGVVEATVNLPMETATVVVLDGSVSRSALAGAIQEAGYEIRTSSGRSPEDRGASEEPSDSVEESSASKSLSERTAEHVEVARRRMWTAWLFTAPIMLAMALHMLFGIVWPSEAVLRGILTGLALPVLVGVGRATYRSGIKALFRGAANMDSLIVLGTAAAFLTGPLSFVMPVASYAGVSAMIMAFHLTGRYIEESAKGRASEAIRSLMDLQARTAVVEREGEEQEIDIDDLRVGDVMLVRPGQKIPTDGVVVGGRSAVDESVATGESMPVEKTDGDEVIGSTINREGMLRVKATEVGDDTFLAQVVQLVEEAQGTKVPIQSLADRVTGTFVPVVIGIAVATFALWFIVPSWMQPLAEWGSFLPWVQPGASAWTLAVSSMVAVFVIACPCALGLATPTALMVGSGLGAQHGILIRSGEAIQTLKDVAVVVFDKTGTLTHGTPDVTEIHVTGGAGGVNGVNGADASSHALLQWAASAEHGSEHPLGEAIVRAARQRSIEIRDASDFEAVRGRGVVATVDGETVRVGTRQLLSDGGIDASPLEGVMQEMESQAQTAVLVARGDQLLGAVGIADTLKPEASFVIDALHTLGIETAVLTGDNERTARAIADRIGIDRVVAEVLPDGKTEEVKRLQGEYGRTAFVGDGINDAPALTQADVGIAIGTGTDVAIEASDVTLVRGDLRAVLDALRLSRSTFRTIQQNLFWAFFYNVVMVPLAVIGWMHPLLAELAMATSSITVVGNANRLRSLSLGDRPDDAPAAVSPVPASETESTRTRERDELQV